MENTREMTRNQTQKIAVFAVYDVLTYVSMGHEVDIEDIISGLAERPYEECDNYLKKVVLESIKHINEIIPVYNTNMKKWTFDRLNRVEQAILLVAYAQFHYVEKDIDKRIVIDVAIKHAKTYCDPLKDYKFVNAILDKVLIRAE
ncbi:MAG: hypothetical protein MJ241_06665 [Bacilli bacterium]|nr:hypothetical protein [Bacilli bacterium]